MQGYKTKVYFGSANWVRKEELERWV